MTGKPQLPPQQQHLTAFWDQLDEPQRAELAEQLQAIDFDRVAQLYAQRDRQGDLRAMLDRAGPPPAFRLDVTKNRFTPLQARQRGQEALREGSVGVLLVAGGQGTRLGFEHPKGMFPIGPISGKTLFQIHVEKIVASARRYGAAIPLLVMTSPATHAETVEFFAKHDRFGLAPEDFIVFCQGTMPAVDLATGQILLDSPHHIAVSPDGHGGMLAALKRSGALGRLEARGIQHLYYFQVDNPLVDICDPEFLGYHLLSTSEMSTQVVGKQDPLERVGNVIEVDGRLMVVEYSDLPDDVAARRDADGRLAIWAGSIAVHGIETSLLRRMADHADGLPFHIAKKKVPYIDGQGRKIAPEKPNAIKFERFIFDLIPEARRAIVIEVDADKTFAPLKNAPGADRDTPEWVKSQMAKRHRDWLRAAGASVADDVTVEISPLWALDAEEVAAKLGRGVTIEKATYWG